MNLWTISYVFGIQIIIFYLLTYVLATSFMNDLVVFNEVSIPKTKIDNKQIIAQQTNQQ